MKVALCLHGLFNSTTDRSSLGSDGYEHIKKHILDVVDTDVFIHSWEVDKIGRINELYKPTSASYQHQLDFTDFINEHR